MLVGNLNTRNDQLRTEVATTQAELAQLQASDSRGDTSVGQLPPDLARLRAWAGLDPVDGPGRPDHGQRRPIDGASVEDLINELRNSGAEAIAIGAVRVEPNSIVEGPAGSLLVESTHLADPFEISAIGNPSGLTGSLTRAGGIIAQLGATDPTVQLTVTPVDLLRLPATTQTLVPVHGTPRL